MVYALDHSECAETLVALLWHNTLAERTPTFIIPRLYLVSDILYNCAAMSTIPNGWAFRSCFENLLPEMFEHFNHILRY